MKDEKSTKQDVPCGAVFIIREDALAEGVSGVLSVMEFLDDMVVCLIRDKKSSVDPKLLERLLGAPVVEDAPKAIKKIFKSSPGELRKVSLKGEMSRALEFIESKSAHIIPEGVNPGLTALCVLSGKDGIYTRLSEAGVDNYQLIELYAYGEWARNILKEKGIEPEDFGMDDREFIKRRAERIAAAVRVKEKKDPE